MGALGHYYSPGFLERGVQLAGRQRCGRSLGQLLGRNIGAGEINLNVGTALRLEAPAFVQGSSVESVEAERVDQLCCLSLGVGLVAGYGQGAAVRCSGGPGELGDVVGQDVVEDLDRAPGRSR